MKLALSRIEIFFIINFVMLGVVMYWTGLVVQPTLDILETQKTEIQIGTTQQQEIIANQNNNTALLVELFERQNKLLANQIVLVTKLSNATNTLQQANSDINGHVETIIGQSNKLTEMVEFFRQNFGDEFLGNETIERSTSKEILGNVTRIGDMIREMIDEVKEIKEISINATH